MDGRESDKFTFGKDGETTKPAEAVSEVYGAPPANDKKIPVALYLFLGLLFIGMIAAYFDLYRRVTHSKSTGNKDLTRLAENLEDRFSSLSIKQATLGEQLIKKISDDEQIIGGLKTELKKARADYNALKKQLTSKADQSKLAVALSTLGAVTDKIAKIDTDAVATLQKIKLAGTEIDTMKSDIRTAQEDLAGEIDEIGRQFERSSKIVIELESRVETLDTAKIDKKTVKSLIQKQLGSQQSTSATLSKKIADFRGKINTNRRQIIELEKNASVYESEILKLKRQLKSIRSGMSKRTSKKASPSQLSTSSSPTSTKSGGFSQQNLDE